MSGRHQIPDPFGELTWGDLMFWAGRSNLSSGRQFQKSGAVTQLARTQTGGLLGWVAAEEPHAAHVEIEEGELYGECTCQGKEGCEHGVAVVLEYIAHLRKNIAIPTAPSNDPRYYLL